MGARILKDEEYHKHEKRLKKLEDDIERRSAAGEQNRSEASYHLAWLARKDGASNKTLQVWTLIVAIIAAALSLIQLITTWFLG